MAWSYSDWPTLSTTALKLARLNLHIAEVADRIGNERTAGEYSTGSGTLGGYMTTLLAQQARLEAKPGTSCTSNLRVVRRGRG